MCLSIYSKNINRFAMAIPIRQLSFLVVCFAITTNVSINAQERVLFQHENKAQVHQERTHNSAEANRLKAMSNSRSAASINVDPAYSVEDLIQDVFIGGGCFDIANISYSGNNVSKAYFTNGNSSIGIEDGIIISTGNTATAIGPNVSNATGSGLGNAAYDIDLLNAVSNSTDEIWDQTTIEFDFTPTTDMVSFEYVFASEEYCEFAGDEYNDVFGFFISGPGIDGPFQNKAENIALVPNTNRFVSINSVNHFTNSNYYIRNERPAGGFFDFGLCNYNVDPHAPNDIEYDGFTKVLTATANVIPCETYHIKLTIADGEDDIYDSAVFLKANSFNAGGSAVASAVSNVSNSNEVYERCNDAYFLFERTSDDLEEAIDINFTVLPTSTATSGEDYMPLPSSITIPAGEMEYLLTVEVLDDALIEGQESLIIETDKACSCSTLTTELIINDTPPFEIIEQEYNTCKNEEITIAPTFIGGVPPFNDFVWSTGATGKLITVNPQTPADYFVTVTDQCGQSVSTSYHVELYDEPSATLQGNEVLCSTDEMAALQINLEGVGPWNIFYTIDGLLQEVIISDQNTYTLETNIAGNYELVSVEDTACEGNAIGTASVQISNIITNATTAAATCYNDGFGSIDLSADGGIGTYTYAWSNPMWGNIEDPSIAAPGTYEVTISDDHCSTTTSVSIIDERVFPESSIAAPQELTCNDPSIQLVGSNTNNGGTYTYSWQSPNGNIISGNTTLTPTIDQEGIYQLITTDESNGCTIMVQTQVILNNAVPLAMPIVDGELTCINTQLVLDINSANATNISYEWTTTDGNILSGNTSENPTIDAPGEYLLITTNLDNGCTKTETLMVTQNIEAPSLVMAPGAELTCNTPSFNLAASINSSMDYNYDWRALNGGQIVEGDDSLTPLVNAAGTYSLFVTNIDNGCTAMDEVTITENTDRPTTMRADHGTPKCKGDMTQITFLTVDGGVEPYLYSIDGGENFFMEQQFNNLPAGTYDLMIQDANGCELAEIMEIADGNSPEVEVESSIELNLGDSYNISAFTNLSPSQIDSITWYPPIGLNCTDCLDPTVTPMSGETYTITVVDENGCQDEATIQFRVVYDGGIFVPNAFSPNADGVNDLFELYARPNLVNSIQSMSIFDRWGSQVYQVNNVEADDRDYGWNGMYRGRQSASGVYVYFIQVELVNGDIVELEGDITLVH